MIWECSWHGVNFPEETKPIKEIEPLGQDGVTSGLCPRCFAIEMEKAKSGQ